MSFIEPPVFNDSEIKRDVDRAAAKFCEDRLSAKGERDAFYDECFDEALARVREIFVGTDNLRTLFETGGKFLRDKSSLYVMRYLARPTVSADDFGRLSGCGTTSASKFADADMTTLAMDYITANLNTKLACWLNSGVEPSETDVYAAEVAIATLVADQKTKTRMRTSASKAQEKTVRDTIVDKCSYAVVDGTDFQLPAGAPKAFQVFKKETLVGGSKADVVLGLPDGRFMCLECKVSNSEVNSYKRLNHETTDKAERWRRLFGQSCVCGCVLQGCFKVENVISAQKSGVSLFWSYDLQPLVDFINACKEQ